ncbi:hypothetical protein ACLSZU_05960 [Avibacterium avium]
MCYRVRNQSITQQSNFSVYADIAHLDQPIHVLEERLALMSILGFTDTSSEKENYLRRLKYLCDKALELGQIELYRELRFKRDLVQKHLS